MDDESYRRVVTTLDRVRGALGQLEDATVADRAVELEALRGESGQARRTRERRAQVLLGEAQALATAGELILAHQQTIRTEFQTRALRTRPGLATSVVPRSRPA